MMTSPGFVVARALAGAWRDPPPPDDIDAAALAEVEEQLMRSGAGGLAWWRIRSQPALGESRLGQRFLEAFKMNTIYARAHEDQISRVMERLRAEGIESLLFKGWDCARNYPHAGMRPYGDIDLCVRGSGEEEGARAILAGTADAMDVDLKHDIEIEAAWIPDLFDRSASVPLGETTVRVMGAEDRLRTLALHALKGEVWRPLSLCDVALAVETRPGDFDWEICLTEDPIVRDWVLTALSLAGNLLGADIAATPAPAKAPPRWLVRNTLKTWSAPWPAVHGVELAPLPHARKPRALLRGLVERWPGPVQATLSGRARFGVAPRLPLRLADAFRRTTGYVGRRPRR